MLSCKLNRWETLISAENRTRFKPSTAHGTSDKFRTFTILEEGENPLTTSTGTLIYPNSLCHMCAKDC